MHLKKIFIVVFTASLFASVASANEDDALLSALLESARKNNPQIMAAEQRTKAAEAQIARARAKMSPSVSAGAGALWLDDAFSVAAELPVTGVLSMQAGYKNTYVAAAALTQIIYSGGSLSAEKEAAKLARDAAAARETRTLQSVENAVRKSYYALKSAQAKELVAEEAVELSKKHTEQAEKLFNAGVVAKNDVLRSKVAASAAELDLIRARNASGAAEAALQRAVGAALPKEISNKTPLSETTSVSETDAKERDVSRDVEAAFDRRSELRAYSLLSRQAERLERAAKGQTLPQILGGVGYVAADDKFFPSEQSEPMAALGLYWNIYDGGASRAKAEEAKSKAKELLFLLEDMKNVIRTEVTQAELSLRSAHARLAVASRQAEEAREDYRIAKRRYEENVGTNIDALDARLALTDSISELVLAVYDIKAAEADLLYAMGE